MAILFFLHLSCKIDSSIRILAGNNLIRRTFKNKIAALVSALRAKIDDIIRRLDDIEIVLNDNDGVAIVNQTIENTDELFNIIRMKTGRRLIKSIESLSIARSFQFISEFDTLRFTA